MNITTAFTKAQKILYFFKYEEKPHDFRPKLKICSVHLHRFIRLPISPCVPHFSSISVICFHETRKV